MEADALACICAAAVQGRQALGSDAGKAAARLGREPNSQIISRRCTRYLGFSLHANVRVSGCSRSRLERLIRYAARPAIASERLSLAKDGRVVYKFKRRWKDASAAVALEPLAFLERLAVFARSKTPPSASHLSRRPCSSCQTSSSHCAIDRIRRSARQRKQSPRSQGPKPFIFKAESQEDKVLLLGRAHPESLPRRPPRL